MRTNHEVRELLNLSPTEHTYTISQVSSLSIQDDTLMFINRAGVNLEFYDQSSGCTFLIDEELYPEYKSERNDFIRVSNPKYKFCLVVAEFDLPSAFQRYCRESIVGKRCQIDRDTIIGGTDFSPVLADDGSLVQFPQMGGVQIGDDVVIKYHTMVGKGTFGYTEIGDNTMIDFGCQIGHNCIIGKRCIIAAGTIIGGSTIVGDNTTIGIGAKIRNGLYIGSNVSIGMGSVVIRDIPDNSVVVGNPAHIIEHEQIFNKEGLR